MVPPGTERAGARWRVCTGAERNTWARGRAWGAEPGGQSLGDLSSWGPRLRVCAVIGYLPAYCNWTVSSLRAGTLRLQWSVSFLNRGKAWALESKGSKTDGASSVTQNHNLSAWLLQWADSSILVQYLIHAKACTWAPWLTLILSSSVMLGKWPNVYDLSLLIFKMEVIHDLSVQLRSFNYTYIWDLYMKSHYVVCYIAGTQFLVYIFLFCIINEF